MSRDVVVNLKTTIFTNDFNSCNCTILSGECRKKVYFKKCPSKIHQNSEECCGFYPFASKKIYSMPIITKKDVASKKRRKIEFFRKKFYSEISSNLSEAKARMEIILDSMHHCGL